MFAAVSHLNGSTRCRFTCWGSTPSPASALFLPAPHGNGDSSGGNVDRLSLHYIGVGEEEMTGGFAVFDTQIRAGMPEVATPFSQR